LTLHLCTVLKYEEIIQVFWWILFLKNNVSDLDPIPDPDPPDPHVFEPPGSGSIVRGIDPDPVPSIMKQK
jgi:hypothetical protein